MEYQVTVRPLLDTGRMRSVRLHGGVFASQLEQILEKILVDQRFHTGYDPRQVKIKNKVEKLLWCLRTKVSPDAIQAYRSEPAIDPIGERMTVDLTLQYYGMPLDVLMIRLRFPASLNVLSAPADASSSGSDLYHASGWELMEATELGLATIHVPEAANLRGIAGELYYHRRSFEVTEIKEVVSSSPNSDIPAYVICKFGSTDAAPYATALFIDDFFRDWAPLGVGRVIGLDGERHPNIDDHGTGDVILALSDKTEAGELSATVRVLNDRGYWSSELGAVPFRALVLHPKLNHSTQAGQVLRVGSISFIETEGAYHRLPNV